MKSFDFYAKFYRSLLFFLTLIASIAFWSRCEKREEVLGSRTEGSCDFDLSRYRFSDTLAYQHLKYHMATVPPESFFPASSRLEMRVRFDSLWQLTNSMSYAQAVDFFKLQEAFSDRIAYYLKATEVSIGMVSDSLTIMSSLDNLFGQSVLDSNITCDEKKLLSAYFGTIKGSAKYFLETLISTTSSLQEVTYRGCWHVFFGCVLSVILLATVVTVALITFPPAGVFLVDAIVFGAAAGVAGFLTLDALTERCNCNEPPPPPPPLECRAPLGVSIAFSNCTDQATYTPWGVGKDVTFLDWINTDGTPASTSTSFPHSLLISQNVVGVPVSTLIKTSTSCPSDKDFETSIDLSYERLQVPVFIIAGAESVESSEVGTYEVAGDAIASSIIDFQFQVDGGTIVSSTDYTVTVQWNLSEESPKGWVKATAQNTCPNGNSRNQTFKVRFEDYH